MMKVLLIILFSLLILLSCKSGDRSQTGEQNEASEEAVDTVPMATTIFWIDRDKSVLTRKKSVPLHVHTAKAKVNITHEGVIELISYVKPQKAQVIDYLKQKLNVFRIKPMMIDSGFVKPGVQYVQLRYIPEKIDKER